MPTSDKVEKRIHNRLPFAWEGIPFIAVGLCLTILCLALGLRLAALFLGLLTLFIIYFFRDPERQAGIPENAVLTPADGKIIDIRKLTGEKNPLGDSTVKISIFMSVFNVHVNRSPAAGRITNISYHPGKFFSANLDKASLQNEHNSVTLETSKGQSLVFVQIAGLIARRIVCWVKEGDVVTAGQRFGLIRFGSRLDVFLPPDTQVLVQTGQHVKAGKTLLGTLA